MALQTPLKSKTQMLIRKPASDVYMAFVDPEVTTKFWFTKSSGELEVGKDVRWHWEMYGVSTPVMVKSLDKNKRIVVEWGDPPRTVEWLFEARGDDATLVRITESGFRGTDDEVAAGALDSKGGFTIVLAGLKAWLEHGVRLNLVADQNPGGRK